MSPASRGVGADQRALAADLEHVAARLRRATVRIAHGGRGVGSGVLWRSGGLVVTNAHVISSDRSEVSLHDGRRVPASLWRRDRRRDLAALTVAGEALEAAPIGDSDALRPGELVLAVGNPFGLAGALAVGVVHALVERDGTGRPRWICADLRLAPGHSGGPLADAGGRVVGVTSMVAGGLALAIPSADVERFLA